MYFATADEASAYITTVFPGFTEIGNLRHTSNQGKNVELHFGEVAEGNFGDSVLRVTIYKWTNNAPNGDLYNKFSIIWWYVDTARPLAQNVATVLPVLTIDQFRCLLKDSIYGASV